MVDPENHSPEADMYQRLWQPSCVVGSRRHRPETIDVECGCNSKSCFGGPVEEKAFTDLVHIESGLEGGAALHQALTQPMLERMLEAHPAAAAHAGSRLGSAR